MKNIEEKNTQLLKNSVSQKLKKKLYVKKVERIRLDERKGDK